MAVNAKFVLEQCAFPHEVYVDQAFSAQWTMRNNGDAGIVHLWITSHLSADPINDRIPLGQFKPYGQWPLAAGQSITVSIRALFTDYFPQATAGRSYAIGWAVGYTDAAGNITITDLWGTYTYVLPWSSPVPTISRLVEVQTPAATYFNTQNHRYEYADSGAPKRITDSFFGGFDVPNCSVSLDRHALQSETGFSALLPIGFPRLQEYNRTVYHMITTVERKIDDGQWVMIHYSAVYNPVGGGQMIPGSCFSPIGLHYIHYRVGYYLTDGSGDPNHAIWIWDYLSYDVNVTQSAPPLPPAPKARFVYSQCAVSADQVTPNQQFTINLQLINAGSAASEGDVFIGMILGADVPWKVLGTVHLGPPGSPEATYLYQIVTTACQLANKTFTQSEYLRPAFYCGPVVPGQDLSKFDPTATTDFWEPTGVSGFGIAVIVSGGNGGNGGQPPPSPSAGIPWYGWVLAGLGVATVLVAVVWPSGKR